MKIERTPVTWLLERLYCECGGEMTPTGMTLLSYPPQYQHKCEKCELGMYVHGHTYPRVVYEEVPTVQDPAPETKRPGTG